MVDIKILVKAYTISATRFNLAFKDVSFSDSECALIAGEIISRCLEISGAHFKAVFRIKSQSGLKRAVVVYPIFSKSEDAIHDWLKCFFEKARIFFL